MNTKTIILSQTRIDPSSAVNKLCTKSAVENSTQQKQVTTMPNCSGKLFSL